MILVLGYGNPLRCDDAIGPHIAHRLEQHIRGEEMQVITAHQLTPELVEPICGADLVVFIDARVGARPGEMLEETVEPASGTGAFTHNVSPSMLLGAARELYDRQPRGLLISIIGASFEYGTGLSPDLEACLPALVDRVTNVIHASLETLYPFKEDYHA